MLRTGFQGRKLAEACEVFGEMIKVSNLTIIMGLSGSLSVAVQVLNEHMKSNLTKWQARFRRWYLNELDKDDNKGKSPQELQKLFPEYDDLIIEIQKVNSILSTGMK